MFDLAVLEFEKAVCVRLVVEAWVYSFLFVELACFNFSICQLAVKLVQLRLDRLTLLLYLPKIILVDLVSLLLLLCFSFFDDVHPCLHFGLDCFGARVLLLHEFRVIMF